MSADSVLARTLYVPVAAIRPYLVLKGTLLLLAFDMWLTRIEHGGRYSAGGFNVSHFAILDLVQPQISAELYVGVSVLTGLLCFVLAIAPRPPRWLIAIAFVLHTWSWAMSMLDSYQHHYLLSIVLFALIFFPRITAEEALVPPKEKEPAPPPEEKAPEKKGKKKKKEKKEKAVALKVAAAPSTLLAPPPVTSAWAYVLLSVSIAIVYAYTAFSKTADEWLAGDAFKRVLRLAPDGTAPRGVEDFIAPVRDLAAMFGVEGQSFWWFMGHSVVLVQIICCAGYVLAPFLDVTKDRFLRIFSFVALFTALSFHLGAEYMELKIGWFSWYMVGYALVYFLPATWIAAAARLLIPLEGSPLAMEALAVRIVAGVLSLAGAAVWTPFGVVGGGLLLMSFLRPFVTARMGPLAKIPPYVFAVSAAIGAGAVVLAGTYIDLPGAQIASFIGAAGLVAGAVALFAKRVEARTLHAYGVGALAGAIVFYVAIVASPLRADFYRKISGYQRRLGHPVESYVAAVKANRYAPEGTQRYRWEHRLRRQLQGEGRLPEVD